MIWRFEFLSAIRRLGGRRRVFGLNSGQWAGFRSITLEQLFLRLTGAAIHEVYKNELVFSCSIPNEPFT